MLSQGFCNIFEEFLADIGNAYPSYATDFNVFLSTVKLARMMKGDEYIVDTVMGYLEPYSDKIKSRDESFFLAHSFDEEKKDGDVGGFIEAEIDKIKDLWKNADPATKDCIHDYFLKLLKIGEKVKDMKK